MNMVRLLNLLPNIKSLVVVGAGWYGDKIIRRLLRKNVEIRYVFDNDRRLHNKSIYGIKIIPPTKLSDPSLYYVVSTREESRNILHNELVSLDIDDEHIILLNLDHENRAEYHATLREDEYKGAISDLFYYEFGREMNWENPTTYNEKINWEKLNDRNPLKTQLTDKYLVRNWIKQQIGEKYLTELYGVWEKTADIDFDKLPQQFVLKTNHASTHVIVVKDKSKLDLETTIKRLNEWLNVDWSLISLELQYKYISRKIICEEYLPGVAEESCDYKVYCFHGCPQFVECIKENRSNRDRALFYDSSWNILPFTYAYTKDTELLPRPNNLNLMLELSRLLSRQFRHVRVDWYNLPDGRVVFGEMTFSSWGGLVHFHPEEYDEIWGKFI